MNTQTAFLYVLDASTGTWTPMTSASITPDPFTPGSLIEAAAFNFGFNGSAWEKIRIANVFKPPVRISTAAPTVVWTPASAKKFRLMGFTISAAGAIAVAGWNEITLLDGATEIWSGNAAMQDTIVGDTQMGADFGQGYLSTAADNVLSISMSDDLTDGEVTVTAWGCEEA